MTAPSPAPGLTKGSRACISILTLTQASNGIYGELGTWRRMLGLMRPHSVKARSLLFIVVQVWPTLPSHRCLRR